VLTATALWLCSPELVLALDEHLGSPVDSYVNGSQTWFTGEEQRIEWRLHPVAGFRQPAGLSHYDLWEQVVGALRTDAAARTIRLGNEERALHDLWDGLECFPADGDDLEPATVAGRASALLGFQPELTGLVDHDAVGDAWESSRGAVSVVALLREQLDR
jgi:hypothetical protein